MLFRFIKIFTIALCALVLAVFCLTWLLSPYVIKSQSNDLLSELNYHLSDDSHIRFNPFSFTLSVQDLALQHLESPHVLASIKTGHINVDTFALARNTILFDSILFDGIQLELARTPELFNVAGYAIPLAETVADSNDTEELPAEDDLDQQEGDDWFVEIATFKLDNVLTDLDDNGQPHQIKLDDITLSNILAGLNQQKGHFALKATINDTKVATKINFDLNESLGAVHLEFKLEHLNPGAFAYLAGDAIDALSSNISLSFKQSVTLHEQGISSEVNDLILSVDALNTTLQGVNITNDKLVTKIDKLQLNIESVDDKQVITKLDAGIEVTVDNTRIYPSESKDLLFAVDRLATKNAALSLHDDLTGNAQPTLSLEQLVISNITASQKVANNKESDQTPALFSSSELLINTLFAHAGALSIKSIALAPFSSTVWLDESKAMTNLVLPSPVISDTVNTSQENTTNENKADENKTNTDNTADSGGSVDPENSHEQAPFVVQLGDFRVTGESSFAIRDRSVSPEFEDLFHIQAFDLGAIDNSRPELATPFASEFKTGKYSKASVTGETKLFTEKVNLTLDSKLTEFSLPKVSPYVRTAAGFDLVSGQFDNITKINIVDDEIAGESVLMLRGIDLSSADDVKTGDLTEHSFIPLNLAMGALKDGDGNIEMEIPLSGNVNDPDFGLNGFIALIAQKAALSASESYLINTFVPYANVVSLTKMVGSYALKVRIDDLEYQTGQTEIKDIQEAFIGALVSLLNEKPDLQIKICAMAHSTDIVSHTPDLKNEKDILALKTIANTRGQVFKDYLIEHAQIASARLLLCQAKIDADMDNKPRIEFEI